MSTKVYKNNVYIMSAVRTPIAAFQGAFAQVPATQLGAIVIKSAVERSGFKPDQISEVIMGHVLTAGVGQAPARQSSIHAGLPVSVPCTTINKVCGSGLKAVALAADMIRLGESETVVAGGQENMSLAPHLLENSRAGFRLGPIKMQDALLVDGLVSPFDQQHMGNYTELCAVEYKLSREQQDEFAKQSYLKAQKAQTSGYFQNEIVNVTVTGKKGNIEINVDEEPTKAMFDKMASLKPAFDPKGTITAANASKINDGAVALVLTNEEGLKKSSQKPLAKILGHATFAQDPKWFTTAPVGAIKKVLENSGLKIEDIDLFEVNEAFSAVTMAAINDLKLSPEKVNVHGGAVALGHPIGASGARILTTLVHALHTHNKKYGIAAICLGGGEAIAMAVEKL